MVSRVVLEVEDEDVMLFGVGAVQTRERLNGFDAGKRLVHVHGVEQWFVIAGLEFVGADEEAIWVFLNLGGDFVAGKAVQRRFGFFFSGKFVFAGEGDDRLIRTLAFFQILFKGKEIFVGTFDAVANDHGAGLASNFVECHHLFVEVVDHDFCLQPDGVVMAFNILPQFLLCALRVELGVVFNLLDKLVVAIDGRIALEDIEDEALRR